MMTHRHKGDYPISSATQPNARDILENIGGLNRSERQVARLVQQGKLECTSGRIEVFLSQYQQNPDWRPGGHQRWKDTSVPSGYIKITEAAIRLNRARSTIYGYIERGELATIRVADRQFVSESSITMLLDGLTSEPVTVTFGPA
jgi:hypothetical protein